MAVPTASLDRIVVSFQTLTPEASTRVLRNRSEREDAKAKAASVRRAAKEAKEAKEKVCAAMNGVARLSVDGCLYILQRRLCCEIDNSAICCPEQ